MAPPGRVSGLGRQRANLIPLYGVRGLRQDLLRRLKLVQALRAAEGVTIGQLLNVMLEHALPELERRVGITHVPRNPSA